MRKEASFVCSRVERVTRFSVERPVSQWDEDSGEFLADPTGQTPLLLVKGEDGWRALTRKAEVPTSALQEIDPLGFAIQMMVGDTNGYLSPYKNVFLVPAGMRARLESGNVAIVADDLRDFLIANRQASSCWNDQLLTSPAVGGEDGLLFLSGGLDSVAVLLSYQEAGKPLDAVHIDRPTAGKHELEFARRAAEGGARSLTIVPYNRISPEEAFCDLKSSPFGRAPNFAGFRRVLQQLPIRPYCLSGDMNGLDVWFADHSDRYRGIRRRLYLRKSWRRAFRASRSLARPLHPNVPSSKAATLIRSLKTAMSPALFLTGAAIGPKGFPGVNLFPFFRDDEHLIHLVESRFSTFLKGVELDSNVFDIDFFLFSFRWFVNNSDCTGLQEACSSVGSQVVFPYNSSEAILRQVSTAVDDQVDKRVLKRHFSSGSPELSDIIWFRKDLTIGNTPSEDYVPGPQWLSAVDTAFDTLPIIPNIDLEALKLFVVGQRQGAFAGSSNDTPTERQLNFATLLMRRAEISLS